MAALSNWVRAPTMEATRMPAPRKNPHLNAKDRFAREDSTLQSSRCPALDELPRPTRGQGNL